MATFILKKYSDKEEDAKALKQQAEVKEGVIPEELVIQVTGSISNIIAKALYKALKNKPIELEVIEEDKETEVVADKTIQAISKEDINEDPLSTLRSIQKDSLLFISSEGFNTKNDEWFLYNLEHKTQNVVYSLETFIDTVVKMAEDKFLQDLPETQEEVVVPDDLTIVEEEPKEGPCTPEEEV